VNARPAAAGRLIVVASFATFTLVGWSQLLLPSLIRDVQAEFGQTDAGFGVLYLVNSLLFGTGALLSGVLAARLGRRTILPAAALALASGLALQGLAPAWPLVLAGSALAGLGAGGLDAGVNSVFMDLSVAGRGDLLSRLHLFFSVGALSAPLMLGMLVGAGVDWRLPMLASAVAVLAVVLPLRAVGSVPPRARSAPGEPTGEVAPTRGGLPVPRSMRVPLVALAIAIACYVAAEVGVSSWLVAFLVNEPVTTATLALSLFWLGLAVGRLTAGRLGRRIEPVRYASVSAFVGGAAVAGAVLGPPGAVQIALFAVAGFGFGPIYPMIMAVAGSLYPHRAATVSGLLTTAGVVGSIVYPPLMGFTSASLGLAAGMLGAALLVLAAGTAVIAAARAAGRRREPEPVPVG
jgi:FHS family glucose/mannose:H+ symporter-like MFS transporter